MFLQGVVSASPNFYQEEISQPHIHQTFEISQTYTVGSSAKEVWDTYKEKGSKEALKQAGIELLKIGVSVGASEVGATVKGLKLVAPYIGVAWNPTFTGSSEEITEIERELKETAAVGVAFGAASSAFKIGVEIYRTKICGKTVTGTADQIFQKFVESNPKFLESDLCPASLKTGHSATTPKLEPEVPEAFGHVEEKQFSKTTITPAQESSDFKAKIVDRVTPECKIFLPSAKVADHHIFPRQYEKFFSSRGIVIDDYTITIGEYAHLRGVHGKGVNGIPGGWNKRWGEFIESNPDASVGDIYKNAGVLMDEFNLGKFNIHGYKK